MVIQGDQKVCAPRVYFNRHVYRDFSITLYSISNKGLVEECNKEENLAVIEAATFSCFQRRLYNTLFKVTYSPSHRQAGAPVMNIQSTIRTAPDLCKNVLLAIVFGSRGDLYTVSTQSDMCTYTLIFHSIERLVGKLGRH
jgi:hypothetical protein